jgi:plastocyanin
MVNLLSRRDIAVVAIPSFLLAGSLSRSAWAAEPRAAEIRIDNFTFSPATISVAAGTRVTWINGDDIPHTVVADDHSFRSRTLDTDDRYSVTFEKAGRYRYFCSLHPHMVGTVVVSPSGTPGPTP